MKELAELRKKIDEIDRSIVELLNRRAELSHKVGEIKKIYNIDIIDYSREKEVINKILSYSNKKIPDEDLKNIYREIIASSRKVQKSYTVSILGPEGTFSHIVFKKFFGDNTECRFTKNIKDIFIDVLNEHSRFGIVPVENSIEGSVSKTLDFLYEFDIKIWAELLLKVNFNFISFAHSKNEIRVIYSHPHAVSQCRNFIEKTFLNAEIIELASTSAGIKYLKENHNAGAIVSPIAGDIYNIPVMFKNIEDNPNNFTRFFVISKNVNKIKKGNKSSIIFAVSHKPKSLFNALEVIGNFNLNMCKLESRPIKGVPWEYMFYVDIEGKLTEKFFNEFKNKTTYLKFLGTYPVEVVNE